MPNEWDWPPDGRSLTDNVTSPASQTRPPCLEGLRESDLRRDRGPHHHRGGMVHLDGDVAAEPLGLV